MCGYDAIGGQLLHGSYVLEARAGGEGARFYLQVEGQGWGWGWG